MTRPKKVRCNVRRPISTVLALAIVLILVPLQTYAAAAVANGSCSVATAERIQTCLDQLESDEAKLPGGPCSSSDWRCICTKQQGFIDCYASCPDQMSEDTYTFNKNNCAGQHDGITIVGLGGDVSYTWSDLNIILQGNNNDSRAAASQNSSASGATAAASAANTTSAGQAKAPMYTGVSSNVSQAVSTNTGATAANSASGAVRVAMFISTTIFIITAVMALRI